MIFTDRTITVRKGESKINEPIIVYRGDYELEVRFTIMNSKFKFMSGTNLIESENAAYGQLAILTPYGGNIFSEVAKCNEGAVTFVLTKVMLDQIEEVGLYSFQIRLFDYIKESRISIPPVEFGIEVREPITSEDHDNSVNNAIVGYSIAKVADALNEKVPDTFDADGQYNKTDWETGDRITEGKLNKIEDAIDTINQNEINDNNALNKQMTSNFNVLQNQINNMVIESGNTDAEVEQARGEYNLLNQRLNAMDETDGELASQLTHIESKNNRYISEFGAIGDGVTDDTQALIRAFSEIESGTNLIFKKDATYLISIISNENKIVCEKNNINIIGNNATIKIKDNSGIVEGIINKELTGALIIFTGDNTSIYNLIFDGNYLNNYYENEDGKYYAYHSDINVSGMPTGVVASAFVKAEANNFLFQNVTIKDFCGSGFYVGETSSSKTYNNIKVINCGFRKLFRAGISFHHCKNIEVLNCECYHNQRHNIQFYSGNKNCVVKNCDITTNGSVIPKWYPSWTLGCADNETIGISFGHTSYGDDNDGLLVENNLIRTLNNGLQNGVSLRSYPTNVTIKNNTINSLWYNIAFHSGLRGRNEITGNQSTVSDVFLGIYMNKGDTNYIEPTTAEATLIINENDSTCNNFISFVNLNDNNANQFFASLNMFVKNNISSRSSMFTGLDEVVSLSKSPIINIELDNNIFTSNNLLTNQALMSRSVKIYNKDNKFKLLTRRPGDFSSDSSYVKIAKIRGNASNYISLKGNITQYAGTSYFFSSDFGVTIRFDLNTTTENPYLVDMRFFNTYNLPTDILKFVVTEKNDNYTEGYLYINHRSYYALNLDILYNNCIIEFIDDRKFYSNYQESVLKEYTSS